MGQVVWHNPEQPDNRKTSDPNAFQVRKPLIFCNIIPVLEDLWWDLKVAARSLRKRPAFVLAVVLTLALGIGANTAVFSIIDGMLLRPLPVPNPKGVIAIDTVASRLNEFGNSSYLDWRDVSARAKSFESLCIFRSLLMGFSANPSSAQSKPEAVSGLIVSGNFFDSLQIRPVLGRTFRPEEGSVPDKFALAVISYSLWQRVFHGSATVMGHQMRLNGHLFTIIGVAPQSFTGPEIWTFPQVYIAAAMTQAVTPDGTESLTNRSARSYEMRGRLRAGVSLARAQSELDSIMHALELEHPDTNKNTAMLLRREIDRRILHRTTAPALLESLVLLVLLIACANSANLLLGRASARLRETATQLSLGASRNRLVRQFLTESTILAVAGTVAGLVLSYAVVRGLSSLLTVSLYGDRTELRLDLRVFICALIICCGTVLLYGLGPALLAARNSWNSVIAARGPVSGPRFASTLARRFVIVGQVALCTLLLFVGGLFLKAFRRAQQADLGFNPYRMLLIQLDPTLAGYSDRGLQAFYRNLQREATSMPSVTGSAIVMTAPFSKGHTWDVTIDGYTAPDGEKWLDLPVNTVSPGYFHLMQVPLLAGRDFTEHDQEQKLRLAIVNEEFAVEYLSANADKDRALGRILRLRDGEPIRIIGVARNFMFLRIGGNPDPEFFLIDQQFPSAQKTWQIRFKNDAESAAAEARKLIAIIAPDVAPISIKPMTANIEENALYQPRILQALSGAFALVALLLAVIGLYGVIAFMVTQRTQEIGIRLALGAQRRSVLWAVMRDGLALVAIGLGIGAAIGLLTSLSFAPLLGGGVNPRDPAVLATIAVLLIGAGAVASGLPALRATRIDPMTALRYE